MQTVMTPDETQIQIFASDWLKSLTSKTSDKGQQVKSRTSCRCRNKETADRQMNCPSEKSWPNRHVSLQTTFLCLVARHSAHQGKPGSIWHNARVDVRACFNSVHVFKCAWEG